MVLKVGTKLQLKTASAMEWWNVPEYTVGTIVKRSREPESRIEDTKYNYEVEITMRGGGQQILEENAGLASLLRDWTVLTKDDIAVSAPEWSDRWTKMMEE